MPGVSSVEAASYGATTYGSLAEALSDFERHQLTHSDDNSSIVDQPVVTHDDEEDESWMTAMTSVFGSGFFYIVVGGFACMLLFVALTSKTNNASLEPVVYQTAASNSKYGYGVMGSTVAVDSVIQPVAASSITTTNTVKTTVTPTSTIVTPSTTSATVSEVLPAISSSSTVQIQTTTAKTTSLSKKTSSSSSSSLSSTVESLDGLSFSLNRVGYVTLPYFQTGASTITQYKFLNGFSSVVEPYVDMGLVVQGSASSEIGMYAFTVCNEAGTCYEGSYNVVTGDTVAVNVPCTPLTSYTLNVVGYDVSGGKIESGSTSKAMCTYVRREIRDLTESDLAATMDAMYTLWETTEEAGQKKYGENYHSASYFNIAHDFCAGQRDADHIHQGLGFVPQHIKLTNMFEASMQAVNPAVTMPYWDFTMDVAEGKTIYESVMFTDKTFGTMTKPEDLERGFLYKYDDMSATAIQDGRWAFTKSEVYSDIDSNAFGYLRGPWNMNPSPYISRFATNSAPQLPTCAKYYTGVTNSDYTMFIKWSPFGPHAATHGAVGGVWGCDKLDFLVDSGVIADSASQKIVCNNWGFFMKELWRNYYITPRSDCSTASDLSEAGINCGYECSKAAANDMPATLKDMLGTYVTDAAGNSDDTWNTVRDFVCYGDAYKVFVGDHLESASTADPSFWPVHPTLERLVQLKYMTGVASAFVWPSTSMDVCDLFQCYEEGVKGTHTQCCYGHYETDRLLDFVNRDATSYIGPTNKETMDGTDPTSSSYSMPYIYNHFTWDHCEEDFQGAIETMYSKYLKGEITSTGSSSGGKSPSTPPVLNGVKTTSGGGGGKTASPPVMTSSASSVSSSSNSATKAKAPAMRLRR